MLPRQAFSAKELEETKYLRDLIESPASTNATVQVIQFTLEFHVNPLTRTWKLDYCCEHGGGFVNSVIMSGGSVVPGLRKTAWYTLSAHARNFPEFRETVTLSYMSMEQ